MERDIETWQRPTCFTYLGFDYDPQNPTNPGNADNSEGVIIAYDRIKDCHVAAPRRRARGVLLHDGDSRLLSSRRNVCVRRNF